MTKGGLWVGRSMPWLPPFAQLGRYAPRTARKVLTRLTCLLSLSVCLPEHSWGAMPHAQLGQAIVWHACVRVFLVSRWRGVMLRIRPLRGWRVPPDGDTRPQSVQKVLACA